MKRKFAFLIQLAVAGILIPAYANLPCEDDCPDKCPCYENDEGGGPPPPPPVGPPSPRGGPAPFPGGGPLPDLTISYQYNAASQVLSETVTGGTLSSVSTTEYNLAGQTVRTVNSQGLTTLYSYLPGVNTGANRKGQTVTVTHPGGFTTVTESFCDGRPASLTGTAQVARYFDYGVNADGSIWSKSHIGGADSARWEKSTTGLFGDEVSVEKSGYAGTVLRENFYNSKNQLVKTTATGEAPTLYEYDALGNLTRSGQDADGSDALELAGSDRITDTERLSDATWDTVTTRVYATINSAEPTTVSTVRNRLSGWSDGVVAEVRQSDVFGNETIQTRSIDRAAKTVTDTVTYPDSTVSEQNVTVNGLLQSVRGKNNLTTTYGYDGLGRVISVTEPRIGTTTVAYHTTAGKNGLRASVTNAAGNVTSYDYDSATGRLLWEKNALDQYTRYAYNAYGQVTKIWGDTQYPVEFGYDSYGQQTTMRTYRENAAWSNPAWPSPVTGDLTTWSYDAASGLVTAKTDATNHAVTYTYTVAGKLASRTWARGIVTNYNYDIFGQLLSVDYADETPDIAYTYNRLGQLRTVTNAAGARSFTYNANLALTNESITGIYNKELNYAYTTDGAKGRPLSMSIGEVQNYSYGYDTYGRLNQIATPAGTFTYTRLAESDLLSQLTRPNGVNTTWSYEPHRNLITEVANGSISTFGYTNNAIGNRMAMNRSGSAFSTPDTLNYQYNSRSEVTGANSTVNGAYTYAYAYDPIGNRLTTNESGTPYTYTSNVLNQYTAINTDVPTYDADGNMLTNGVWNYTWNGENRLIQAVNGTAKLQFTYDYMGRRIEKKVFEGEALTKHNRFVYNEYKQIEELDAANANAVQKRYTWQPDSLGLDVPLTLTDVTNDVVYSYTTDANKNVTDLQNATGTPVAHYEYTPFGLQTAATGSYATENPFRFSSEFHDPETGLVYYNYRYYDPILGRWTSKDPLGIYYKTYNLYSFLNNSILIYYDYLGLAGKHGSMLNDKNKRDQERKDNLDKRGNSVFPQVNCITRALLGLIDAARNDPENKRLDRDNYMDADLDFFKRAAEYYLDNYSNPEDWNLGGFTNGEYGLNIPGFKPAISEERLNESTLNVLDTLIHEPQHDLGQEGFGHSANIGGMSRDFPTALGNAMDLIRAYASRQKMNGCCEKTGARIKNLMDKILCDCN